MINEILELYRFIVQWYAGFTEGNNITIICELAIFLNQLWDQYSVQLSDDQKPLPSEKLERERAIIISSIIRIMSQILAKIPLADVPEETVQRII